MKTALIKSVRQNNKQRCLEIEVGRRQYSLPYVRLSPPPGAQDRIREVFVDDELGRRGVTYRLHSGAQGSVHLDAFLDYNRDPRFLQDLLKHELTLLALELIGRSGIARSEVRRRLRTSPAQLARLLDTANCTKSVDQMLRLLIVLGCEVQFAFQLPKWPRRLRRTVRITGQKMRKAA